MDCSKFNKNLNKFIQNNISDEELEEYIEHYHSCHYCREELEIYYLVNKVFVEKDSLDNNSLSNFNLKLSLSENIKKKEDLIYSRYKHDFIVKMMFYIGNTVSIIAALYFIFFVFIK